MKMESEKNLKKSPKVWVILVVLLAGLLIAYVLFRYLKNQKPKNQVRPDNLNESGEPLNETDWQYVYGTSLTQINDKDVALTVAAIASHESGNFSSLISKANNNFFGMKMPSKRETVAEFEKNGYAYYSDPYYSVEDFFLWFKFYNYDLTGKTYEQIVDFMKEKGYFEASLTSYKNAVKKWRTQIKNNYDV